MIWIPRVASGRPWKVETGTPDCEFVGGELAQHDRAGGSQARHAYRVGRCDIVDQYLRMARRGQARDVDNIFDANRDAMQRSAPATRHDLRLGSPGRFHCRRTVKPDEDVQLRIEPADALQQRIHQLNR